MNKRLLRWMTVIAPVGFVLVTLAAVDVFFEEVLTFAEILAALIAVSVGATVFSIWVFGFIDQREAEIRRRANQLEALNAAALALTTELDMSVVLQKVVDLSRSLVSSRYGALGVLDPTGTHFEQFVTSGMAEDQRVEIGAPPQGHGIFKMLIEEGRSVLVEDVAEHELHSGFPKGHPSMGSLLGVPIRTKGRVIGDLYLAEKIDEDNPNKTVKFSLEELQILEMFAIQAAIAIENARLYRQVQELAILEERQRFGMDLHDGVIQSIYAVGLMLENTRRNVLVDPEGAEDQITKSIVSLNNAISDIRNYILELRPQHFQGRDVVQGIEELARALRANTFMGVNVNMEDANPKLLNPEQTVEILHIAQEALSNVQKHARAVEVDISLTAKSGLLELLIVDDGVSIPLEKLENSMGNGLGNMRDRASSLRGEIEIGPCDTGGTMVRLKVPLGR